MEDEKIITIYLGYKNFPIKIENKPQYYDSSGVLCMNTILLDMAEKYKKMSDDVIVFELKKLKTQHKQLVEWYNNNLEKRRQAGVLYSMDIQSCYDEESIKNLIERQMLTNAFALKNGADLEDIRQLCIAKREFEICQSMNYDRKLSYLYREDANMKLEFLSDLMKMFLQYLYIGEIKAIDYSMYPPTIPTFRQIAEKHGLKIINPGNGQIDENFLEHEAFRFAYKYWMDYWPKRRYTIDSNSIVNQMLNKCIFPPYGVAISIGFEDEGQRVLPWHGKLSELTISKLRLKMHAYVHKQVDAYNAILAAYCNMCFNDEPTIAMVRLEFDNVPHNKGKYSKDTSEKFSTYKRYVEQGWTAQIDNLVINEPFYSLYCELKGILKST